MEIKTVHGSDTVDPANSAADPSQTVAVPVDFDGDETRRPASGQAIRYRIRTTHARGGLGEVFRADDLEIGREIALKEIQNSRADDFDSRQRFLLEAEITGRLEHPGIVPVYGLGAYADGRLYYAMRFIEGESLKEALEHFHGTTPIDDQSPKPATSKAIDYGSAQFHGLLRRFVDVCNAIAYAHSRGVLHRDLKPANVMLGKFGETLVVDWGLAKVMKDSPVSNAKVQTARSTAADADASDDRTQDGSVIGTPAYMSPEQASGEIDLLDNRSDIYGLGATLYALLVGKSPVTGPSALDIVRKVQAGEFPTPRSVAPKVPPALEAICLKAMARRPLDRYATAQALAADVEHWIADVPVSAFCEPPLARLRRWARRHRALVSSLSAALVVTALVAGAAAVVLGQKNNALLQSNDELQKARDAAVAQKAEADLQRNKAESERTRAEKVLGFMVDSLRKPDPALDGRTLTVVSLLDGAVKQVHAEFANDPQAASRLLTAIGKTYGGLGLWEKAVPLMERVFALAQKTYPEDHPLRLKAEQSLAEWLKMAHEPKRALAIYEKLAPRIEAIHGKDSDEAIAARANLADVYDAAGQPLRAVELLRQAMKDADARYGVDHPDTIWIEKHFANALQSSGSPNEAYGHFEKVHRRIRARSGPDHPTTLDSGLDLVSMQQTLGKLDEAMRVLPDLLERCRRVLGPDHGRTLAAMNVMALVHEGLGNTDEAMKLYAESFDALERKHGSDAIDVARRRSNLAGTYLQRKMYREAIEHYTKAQKVLKQKLGEANPDALVVANNLAYALDLSGEREKAIPIYREVHAAMAKELGADHPQTLTVANNLAYNYKSLKRMPEAIALYETCLSLYRARHGNEFPDTLRAINNLAMAYQAADQTAKSDVLSREFVDRVYARRHELPTNLTTRLRPVLERILAESKRTGDEPAIRKYSKILADLPPPKTAKKKT